MPQRLHRVSTALFPENLCVDRDSSIRKMARGLGFGRAR